jgi:hypothetical protein
MHLVPIVPPFSAYLCASAVNRRGRRAALAAEGDGGPVTASVSDGHRSRSVARPRSPEEGNGRTERRSPAAGHTT